MENWTNNEKLIEVVEPVGDPRIAIVLSHGYSDTHRSAFITTLARSLAKAGHGVVTFAYRYSTDRNLLSSDLTAECNELRQVISQARSRFPSAEIILVGKSLGGLISAVVCAGSDQRNVSKLIILGFPLKLGFPPRLPPTSASQINWDFQSEFDRLFESLRCSTLVVQGSEDDFGTIEECERFLQRHKNCRFRTIPGATHGFVSKVNSEKTYYDDCIELILNGISE